MSSFKNTIMILSTVLYTGTVAAGGASQSWVKEYVQQTISKTITAGSTPTPCTAVSLSCGVFATRMRATGDMVPTNPPAGFSVTGATGLERADEICNYEGNDAVLGSAWSAWLSTNTQDAKDRALTPAARYYRNGSLVPLANSQTIISNSIASSINGASLSDAWTGTLSNGTASPNTCASWSSSSVVDTGTYGFSDKIDGTWTDSGPGTCNLSRSIYCFQKEP